MKHLDEFKDFSWIYPKKTNIITLVVHGEDSEINPLIIEDLIIFFSGIGLNSRILQTSNGKIDYRLMLSEKIPLENLYLMLPDSIETGEIDRVSSIDIWYEDDTSDVMTVNWTWGSGVHK